MTENRPRKIVMRMFAGLAAMALLTSCGDADDKAAKSEITVAPFGKIAVYRFGKKARNIIVSFSDEKGWGPEFEDQSWGQAWPSRIVLGIDLPQFQKNIVAAGGSCIDYAGAVTSLAAEAARLLKTETDDAPFLTGLGEGAAIAYAAGVQSSPDKIQGMVVRNFCPALHAPLPPCAGPENLQNMTQDGAFVMQSVATYQAPFVAIADPAQCKATDLAAFVDALPDARLIAPPEDKDDIPDMMVAAVTQVNERTSSDPKVTATALGDLPVVEVPAPAKSTDDRLAIVLSGDGGWADIDKQIGERLAKEGISVIGFNSLKYFWEPQTPEDTAADLERIIRHYMSDWHRKRLVLIGFSFGADILPFLYQRLAPDVKKSAVLMTLLAPSLHAQYEVKIGGWVGVDGEGGPAVAPELARLNLPVLCVENTEEDEHPCATLAKPNIERMVMKGDHHFDGDYEPIVTRIMAKTKK